MVWAVAVTASAYIAMHRIISLLIAFTFRLPLLGVRSREMGRLASRKSGRSLQQREKLRAGWLSPQADAGRIVLRKLGVSQQLLGYPRLSKNSLKERVSLARRKIAAAQRARRALGVKSAKMKTD